MRKFSKTLIFIVMAVMMACVFAFAACNTTGNFVYPAAPAEGAVSGNGGLSVVYGEYLYYVNGNQTTASSTNKYTGEVKTGDIVRIKLSDLEAVLALNDDTSIASADLSEEIQKAVYEKAEVVVPMFYYSGNTTETNVNGLFIYGNKLYFTSPNNALSAGGNVLSDQLSVYSCDLDGRNLVNLYAMEGNTFLNAIYEVDGKVYLLYVDTGLMMVDLSADKREAKEISKTATGAKFDTASKSVAYVNDDGKVCTYTAGAEAEVVLQDNANKDTITYTITQHNNGYVYFTKADSEDKVSDFGVFAVKQGSEAVRIYNVTKDSSGTAITYLCYNEQVILTGKTFNSSPAAYQLYLTSGDGSVKDYLLEHNTNDKEITLSRVEGNTLYYTRDGKMYSMDLSSTSGYTAVELSTTITPNGWAPVDTVVNGSNTYFLTFDSNNAILCYQYKEVDGEKKAVSTDITVIVPAEEDK